MFHSVERRQAHSESADAVKVYLNEIGKIPRLKPEEQADLFHLYEAGKRAGDLLSSLPAKTDSQRIALQQAVSVGQDAFDQIVRANLRLVVSNAKRFLGRGVPLLDLIQEGNLGLMKAVKKYDISRGFAFSTCATFWIQQPMRREIAEMGGTFRLPIEINDRITKLRRLEYHLTGFDGVASAKQIYDYLQTHTVPGLKAMTPQKIRHLLDVSHGASMLDYEVADPEESPETHAEHIAELERLENALQTLPSRQAYVIRKRMRYNNEKEQTLNAVGKKLGVTGEYIRVIQNTALERLRDTLETQ